MGRINLVLDNTTEDKLRKSLSIHGYKKGQLSNEVNRMIEESLTKKSKGTMFELFCLQYLHTMFDEVEWLSEKKPSTFDFKVTQNGQSFFGDAKVFNRNDKVVLPLSQKDADFIILKRGKIIRFIERGDFPNYITIMKNEKMVIYPSKELKDKLKERCVNEKRSLNNLVLVILEEVMK